MASLPVQANKNYYEGSIQQAKHDIHTIHVTSPFYPAFHIFTIPFAADCHLPQPESVHIKRADSFLAITCTRITHGSTRAKHQSFTAV
jgi:hypothetical protein